jgi:hypothetical protein
MEAIPTFEFLTVLDFPKETCDETIGRSGFAPVFHDGLRQVHARYAGDIGLR